jgi:hypothetical protein
MKFIKRADEVNKAFRAGSTVQLQPSHSGTGDICLTSHGGQFIKQAQKKLMLP